MERSGTPQPTSQVLRANVVRAVEQANKSKTVRTCIGCRARRPDTELVRVAIVGGELAVDTRGDGRGAWVCRSNDCADAAGTKKAFSRAFRSRLADRVLADTLLGWLGNPTH